MPVDSERYKPSEAPEVHEFLRGKAGLTAMVSQCNIDCDLLAIILFTDINASTASTLDINPSLVQNRKLALESDSELSEDDHRDRHGAYPSNASMESEHVPQADASSTDASDTDVPIARPFYLERVYPGGGKLRKILDLTDNRGKYNNILVCVFSFCLCPIV